MERIGEVLVSIGACDTGVIDKALDQQSLFGGRIGTNLLDLGALHEAKLAAVLELLHGVRGVSGDIAVDPSVVTLLPRSLVERYEAVPYRASGREMTVLLADPRNCQALDAIAFATGKRVRPFVVPEARLWRLMRRLYGIDRGLRGIEVDVERPCPVGRVLKGPPGPASDVADLMSEAEFSSLYEIARFDRVK